MKVKFCWAAGEREWKHMQHTPDTYFYKVESPLKKYTTKVEFLRVDYPDGTIEYFERELLKRLGVPGA